MSWTSNHSAILKGKTFMTLDEIGTTMYAIAEAKGLREGLSSIDEREATLVRLALIHTEVSEAAQIVKRFGMKPTDEPTDDLAADLRDCETRACFAEELADAVIRIAELATHLRLDLDQAVLTKLAVNNGRPMYYGTPQEETAR
jgi:hypothetical protein